MIEAVRSRLNEGGQVPESVEPVEYLVCGLGFPPPTLVPEITGPDLARVIKLGEFQLRAVDVVYPDDDADNPRMPRRRRFMLSIREGDNDDPVARRFLEAVSSSMVLVYGPISAMRLAAIRLPSASTDTVDLSALLDGEIVGEFDFMPDWDIGIRMMVNEALQVPVEVYEACFRCVPVVLQDPYFTASYYYFVSMLELSFIGGDRDLVLAHHPEVPVSAHERAKAENALQNAFKAIERLIGEPPKDDRKLQIKLKEMGIDPNLEAGWAIDEFPNEPLWKKVRTLQKNRDSRAAHALSSGRQPLTYYEVMDAQGCAETILQLAVMNQLGPS